MWGLRRPDGTGRVGDGQRRFVHIKGVMVEDVESSRTELEFHPLCMREGFAHRQVGIPRSRSTESVPAEHVRRKRSEVIKSQGGIERRQVIGSGNAQDRELIRTSRHWGSRSSIA